MNFITIDDLPFLAYSVATLALRVVPSSWRLRWCDNLAGALGTLWYRLDRRDAALTRRNLQGVFGRQLPTEQIDATVRAVFRNVALQKLLFDMLPILTLPELSRFLRLEGEEHLRQALSQGQGVVFLGTHFGHPGYPPLLLLKRLGYQIAAVLGEDVQPDDSWIYRHFVFPIRRRAHVYLQAIAPNGLPQRQMADLLKQNQTLMILGDVLDEEVRRLPAPHVLPAPLLGHWLPLKTGPFRLAHWLGSPIVPFFIIPRPGGFALRIEPPLQLSDDGSTQGLMDDLAAFTRRFEPYLARYPALWMHWRHESLLDLMQPVA